MESSAKREIRPITGFDFARSILDQKGDEAVEILLRAAMGTESDWLEKKAAVYRSESKDKEYREALEKCCDPKEIEQAKVSLNNELLAIIAIAVVAIHNSRGGVLFIGIDDTTNEPVSFAENDGSRIWMNGKDEYARRAVQDRLFRENKEFKYPKESWIVPTKEIEVISRWCHYKEAEVLALIIPPLPLGKYPLEIECIKNSAKRRFVPCRSAGDVGRVKKVEIKEVNSVAQLNDYLKQRQELFLDREDLSVKLKELGISFFHLPSIAADAVPARDVYSSVNPPQASIFVGRTKELESIHKLLQEGRIPIVTAPGGTGKSELAFKYADQHKHDYPGGLFQINMETIRSWDEIFQAIGRTSGKILGLKNPSANQEQNSGHESQSGVEGIRKALIRRFENDGPILLVLDNIESVKAFFKEPTLQKQGLPTGVRMLATARSSDINFPQSSMAKELTLCDLSPEEALDLLIRERPASSDKERKAAENIARLLDYRALHLRAIPALLDDAYSPLADSYVALEEALRKNLLGTVDKAMEEYEEGERTPSVLWSLTRKSLLNHSAGPSWVKLAHIASFFSPDGFRLAILRHLWGKLAAPDANNDLAFNQALAILKKHGLVANAGQTLRMHRLTSAALRRSAREADATIEETIGKTLAGYDGMSPEDWLALVDHFSIVKFTPRQILLTRRFFNDGLSDTAIQVRMLLQNPNVSKIVDWNAFCGNDWGNLIMAYPQFANKCDWKKVEVLDLIDVLKMHPQITILYPWETLEGFEWASLLAEQPQLADKCQSWDKFNGMDWVSLLEKQPQFSERCQWQKLDLNAWARLFAFQPQFANKNILNQFETRHWAVLLANQPQFADKCQCWDKFNGEDWSEILVCQPQFADKCQMWDSFSEDDWIGILENQPQFANKCDWNKINIRSVIELLKCHPHLASLYPWDRLNGETWTSLLREHPQFAEKCQYWEEFSGLSWASLLEKQPQFAERCPWDKLSIGDLARLFASQPQFAKSCTFDKFGGEHWSVLLASQPQFADSCNWHKLGGNDWASLLSQQPQFAEYCNWDKLNGEDWASLLSEQPQFEHKCQSWDKLHGKDWGALLGRQPQFADRCPWDEFDANDWIDFLWCADQFACHCPWTKFSGVERFAVLNMIIHYSDYCVWDQLNGNDWVNLLMEEPQFAVYCHWDKLDENAWHDLLVWQPQLAKNKDSGTTKA